MRQMGVFKLVDAKIDAPDNPNLFPQVTVIGALAISIIAEFQYGSGGEKCSVVVQTAFGVDGTWLDIARFDFGTVSEIKHCNLEGLLSIPVKIYNPLLAEGVNDGILGDRFRAVENNNGEYVDTKLSVRLSVR